MVDNRNYTTIDTLMQNLYEHPMLRDLTLDQVIKYVVRFIGLHGYNSMYEDKEENVEIRDYRGVLPCDLVRIIQVKELSSGICLAAMTDSFAPGLGDGLRNHTRCCGKSFKTQGNIIYTSFPEGEVKIAYKSIPVDENHYPMIMDNDTYLAALEAFIKKNVFNIKYDQGKIPSDVYHNADKEYRVLAAQLKGELNLPSMSEMESISRYLTSSIKSVRSFDNGFRDLNQREYLKPQPHKRF